MSSLRRLVSVLVIAAFLAAIVPAAASGAVLIYPNVGVSSARIGMNDATATGRLGRPARSGRDTSYSNQVVYYYCYGTRMSGGVYPLTVYSNSRHQVFCFSVRGTAYATSKGVRVGTSESRLKRLYSLRRYASSVYTRYSMGGRSGSTDFYVKNGSVTQIVVRSY